MDLLFFGRSPDLRRWQSREAWPDATRGPTAASNRGCNQDAYERVIATEAPGAPVPDGPHRRAAAAILRYDIFPPHLLAPILASVPVEVGDTVGGLYSLAPGVKIFFASRVIEKFDGASPDGKLHRTGFTYRTLSGHPELGEETFCVEKDLATGTVTVALRSWSRTATLLARAGSPFVRRMQVAASRAALEHLEACSRS